MNRVRFFPYTLSPATTVGSVAGRIPHPGFLLRVDFSDNKTGFADCHPWPELGDLPLEGQKALLKKGYLTALTRRALENARLDADARAERKSLWEGFTPCLSHALVGSLERLNEDLLSSLARNGFTHIKAKAGQNWRNDAERIQLLQLTLKQLGLKLRLDFNSALSLSEFEKFLGMIAPEGSVLESGAPELNTIDFIEDPIPYDPEVWSALQARWGVRLALDRIAPEEYGRMVPGSFSVLIFKPAIQDSDQIVNFAQELNVELVVTTYIGHPFGQACDAWFAARIHRDFRALPPGGFYTHLLYKEDLSFENLKYDGALLVPPAGNGFGMDKYLENLLWKDL